MQQHPVGEVAERPAGSALRSRNTTSARLWLRISLPRRFPDPGREIPARAPAPSSVGCCTQLRLRKTKLPERRRRGSMPKNSSSKRAPGAARVAVVAHVHAPIGVSQAAGFEPICSSSCSAVSPVAAQRLDHQPHADTVAASGDRLVSLQLRLGDHAARSSIDARHDRPGRRVCQLSPHIQPSVSAITIR